MACRVSPHELPAGGTVSGCSGSCCVAFPLGITHEELTSEPERFTDGEYILDMVIPLTAEEAAARAEEFGTVLQGEGPFFACRHWNELSRLCMAYESRPLMCSNYPYARKGGCEHGCSCEGNLWKQVWGVTEPSPWPGLYRIVQKSRQ